MGENNSLGRRTFLKATGTAGAAAALGGVASADSGGEGTELLVGVSASATPAAVEAELPENTEVIDRNEALGYLRVRVEDGGSTYSRIDATARINDIGPVKYTENDARHSALGTPDDARFGDQYAPQQVDAPAAWDATEGSEDVTIAVVDQGVKYDHPDLEAQFGSTKGKDFVDGDSDPYPDDLQNEYHGTHVAGIASATTNNGTGVAGMSDSKLLSARSLSEQGSGSTSDIADAVQWAADQGADIINMSLGGGGYTDTMKSAVSYAVNNGALPICAAGNDGSSSVSYPAKYNECVAVSAVDDNEQLASFSQYGDIDVAAPGVDILSCWTTSSQQYNKISGTSMACPAASGVAALGKAVNPDLGPNGLRDLLKNSATDIGLPENKQGAGQVNAANIVGNDGGGGGGGNEGPSASFTTSPDSPSAGDSVTFDASGSSDADGSISSYEWDFGDGGTGTGQTVSHTYESGGDYTATLTVTDDAGATDSASQTVSVGSGGGGGGSCGDATFTDSKTGSLEAGQGDTYTYTAELADPCEATFATTGDADLDCDLYLTLDGRTPTTGDYDKRSWNYGPDEEVALSDSEIDAGSEIGILVDAYSGSGSYTLSMEELGTGGDGGGGGGGGGGGSCGDTSSSSSAEGSLSDSYDDQSYSYATQTANPCQVTVSLDGPSTADFDLYLTLDGRQPETYDYDKRSVTYDSQEQIVVDDVDSSTTLGVLVDSWDGDGPYTLSVEEIGR